MFQMIGLVDSIREMRKYTISGKDKVLMTSQMGTVEHMEMKLFRAQRNLYITAFAMFLYL